MVSSEILIYVVGKHLLLLQLLHDHDKFTSVSKRVRVYIIISAPRLSFKLLYGVFDELTFDYK